MYDVCRLCCSKNFVNNSIFDEENALYLKMSLYLPIKVFKHDRLPQKICDKCSCKVNDFYQFCNETIEVQNRLRAFLIPNDTSSDEVVDNIRIKDNASPPACHKQERGTQTDWEPPATMAPSALDEHIEIKEEPCPLSPIKEENVYDDYVDQASDNSDDISLITLKERKENKNTEINGIEKKPSKKKSKIVPHDLDDTETSLPKENKLSVLQSNNLETPVKEKTHKVSLNIKIKKLLPLKEKEVKSELLELTVFHCCMCMVQCYSKHEMLQHYRMHKNTEEMTSPPPVPPLPAISPLRCARCMKKLSAEQWAAHWRQHWERDRRPFRCARCERTYRDVYQLFKHGLTHKYGSEAEAEARAAAAKRFTCDVCPERFVLLRALRAHRGAAHPEAAARALALRCGDCARSFAHLNSLRRHQRTHSGERHHLCNVCGKMLTSREHLKFHIHIHTGHKPHVCKTCGKGFVKKCNLTMHERMHSGEKPYVCELCGKAFSQRSTLVIHERYHSGTRPYVCGQCGRGFVAKGLLSMHLKSTCV